MIVIDVVGGDEEAAVRGEAAVKAVDVVQVVAGSWKQM